MRLAKPRHLITITALMFLWCGLWGEFSVANVVAGFAIGAAVTALGIGPPGDGTVNPIALGQLMWLVVVDLIKSTVSVASEILTPTDYTNESVIAVQLEDPEARNHFLLLVVAITLTPGTAVVDTDPEANTLYLHLLHTNRREETIEHAHKLARLTCAALPTTRRSDRVESSKDSSDSGTGARS